MSFMKMLKRRGPRTEPWGTPLVIVFHSLNLELFGIAFAGSLELVIMHLYLAHMLLILLVRVHVRDNQKLWRDPLAQCLQFFYYLSIF